MNIKSSKEQIKNAITAYFTKDSFGNYMIPIEKQRPVFLMGAPGIGKTAIMEQIASEMNVGLLSYSMTHHTRQSALGLPFIVHKNYDGNEYDVSEYTMSEIIASIYELMEKSGVKEGILFLDEINCVSETLAPVMLQFLQYKVFGRHRVPDGWIVVTAGNPPEYNKSVREFDIVTWDRLKRIDVEPDYNCWREYAVNRDVHPAVLTYLDIKKNDFYSVKTTVDGKSFVTARGWEDLSSMMKLYELNGINVDNELISQYLQDSRISKEFAAYYDLYQKYKSDYQVRDILEGKASEKIKNRAKAARFDERLSLISLLMDGIRGDIKNSVIKAYAVEKLLIYLKKFKSEVVDSKDAASILRRFVEEITDEINKAKAANNLLVGDYEIKQTVIKYLEHEITLINGEEDYKKAFEAVKKDFDSNVISLKNNAASIKKTLSNIFNFAEEVFPDGQELLIIVTDLTANTYSASFISRYGCEEYFKHNKDLMFYERNQEIEETISKLKL